MRKISNPWQLIRLYLAFVIVAIASVTGGKAQIPFGNNGGVHSSNTVPLSGAALLAGTQLTNSVSASGLAPSGAAQIPNSAIIQNTVRLKLAEVGNNGQNADKLIPQGFTATANVTVQITYAGNAAPPSATISQQNLSVTYNSSSGATYAPLNSITFSNGAIVTVTINSITYSQPTLADGSSASSVVSLENQIDVTYFYELGTNIVPTLFSTPIAASPVPDAVTVGWSWPANGTAGNNYTQLEWSWLEDELVGTYQNSAGYVTDIDLLFANHSTRVDISDPAVGGSYSIPLLYDGPGHLYYRVRAVNIGPGGIITVGPWYASDGAATYGTTPVAFGGHNNGLNWQSNTSFAEEGKRKSVVQYYDGSLRGRQTVTKDNSTNTLVTAETFYDKQGRPALQILPAPGISNIIAYQQNLNVFNTQTQGSDPADFFDLHGVGSPGLSTSSGTAAYYSNSNPGIANDDGSKNIPDAGGYPYSQTIYTQDGTGRIAVQGGVGANYQPGSGHETKYYYGSPMQEELDGLFGTEVGDRQHYFKNMVVDPNQQTSISYVDMHGRTIATALAGAAPAGMTGINNASDYSGQQPTPIVNSNLLANGSNVVKGYNVESVTALLVPATTTYTFNYVLPGGQYPYTPCNGGSTVQCPFFYDLDISVASEDETSLGKVVFEKMLTNVSSENIPGTAIDNSTGTSSASTTPGITINNVLLPPGSYSVRKTLTLRTDKMQEYLQAYLTQGNAFCGSLEDQIQAYYTQIKQNCDQAGYVNPNNVCLELAQPNGQQLYISNYYLRLGLAPNATPTTAQQTAAFAAYSSELAKCTNVINAPASHRLDDIKAAMLSDMKPFSGQYASDPDISQGDAGILSPVTGNLIPYTGLTMYNKYNIFSIDASRVYNPAGAAYFKLPVAMNGAQDYYRDALGNPDPAIPYAQLAGTSAAKFNQEFSDTWEQSLLYYHPEYPKLLFAQQKLQTSYDWVDAGDFANANSMQDANTKGFIGSAIYLNDPFFSVSGVDPTAGTTNMRDAVFGTATSTYHFPLSWTWSLSFNDPTKLTLWQQAYGNVMCSNSTAGSGFATDDAARAACYEAAPLCPPGYLSAYSDENQFYTSAMATQWANLVNNPDQTQADAVWANFKKLYQAKREVMMNAFINSQRPLASTGGIPDDENLVNQGFTVHFPKTVAQAIQQTGASSSSGNPSPQTDPAAQQWYAGQQSNGSYTPKQGAITSAVQQNSANVALGYVPVWTNELLQNSDIANSGQRTAIINDLIGTVGTNGALGTGFLGVCQNAVNNAHPGGATNAPTAGADGFKSFEEVFIAIVVNKYGLTLKPTCNPYVIQFPKPYSSTPAISAQVTGMVDDCMCNQFATVLAAAKVANSAVVNTDGSINLTYLNYYLSSKYGDVISDALFAGLQKCSAAGGPGLPTITVDNTTNPPTTLLAYMLPASQPLPQYLQCGFTGGGCLTCDAANNYTSQFLQLFPLSVVGTGYTGYSGVPLLPADGVSLTDPEVNYNTLYENFLNYKTGLNRSWQDYKKAFDDNNCATVGSCPAGSVPAEIGLVGNASDQPTGGYVAGQLIDLQPGFDFSVSTTSPTLDVSVNPDATVCGSYCPNCSEINVNKVSVALTGMFCPSQPLNSGNGLVYRQSACQELFDIAAQRITDTYQHNLERLAANFTAAYLSAALTQTSTEEAFTVSFQTSEYHYTLYYYDMAGNLVKTVPPKGVHPDYSTQTLTAVAAARQIGYNNLIVPGHTFTTNYRYNSLNQVVAQNTPDAGTSQFWYDALGRLAISQNAQQYVDGKYSYTLYDSTLGRITEVGQKPQTTPMTQALSQDKDGLANWLISNGSNTNEFNKEQITRTTYDAAYQPLNSDLAQADFGHYINQQNLRNRVSYSEVFNYDPAAGGNAAYHNSATYYTYDIHGNVGTLLQDYGNSANANPMNQNGNRFKQIQYEYDLISSKVNNVAYQAGQADAVYHSYSYDAENRLTQAYTSLDNLYYEQDASYTYYKHGPLMQTTLGKLQVQQLNYTYTLQGWLKNVNAGWEGYAVTPAGNPAAAVYGFSLHYYNGDYTPIGGGQAQAAAIFNGLGAAAKQLYNGNIAAMAVSINVPGLMPGSSNINNPMVYNYGYDQLNRIVRMDAYTATNNTFASLTQLQDYAEHVTYDPNGNITGYTRNGFSNPAGTGTLIDNLAYSYYGGTNRLNSINDIAPAHVDQGDISSQVANNYSYDEIGNLTANAAEHINNISWTVYGKILQITKRNNDGSPVTKINYSYDVAGNRISKAVTSYTNGVAGSPVTTWYVRDASGDVMGIYTAGNTTVHTGDLTLTELPLYGGTRLGEIKPNTDVQNIVGNTLTLTGGAIANINAFVRGQKTYELSNHLGNVLVTVSDKKIGVDGNGDGIVERYTADVVGANDYYPGGSIEPGRQFTTGTQYRYGFNGKENDNDIETGEQDYGMRIYDSRIVRFLSVDPLTKKYPFYTPYQFAANSPILSVDIDGMESSTTLNKTESGWYDFFDQYKVDKISYKNSSWIGPVWNWKPTIFVSNTLTSALNQNIETVQSLPSVPHMLKVSFSNSREAKSERFDMAVQLLSRGIKFLDDLTGKRGGDNQVDAFENVGGTLVNGWLMDRGMDVSFDYVSSKFSSSRNFYSKFFASANTNCFVAGTKIVAKDSLKNIEDIVVGDSVWSFNDKTGEVALRKVVALSKNSAKQFLELSVGKEILRTTPGHPFWISNKWVLAKYINIGDSLMLFSKSKCAVTGKRLYDSTANIYNFTVDEFHTYFVSAIGILVHNTSFEPVLLGKGVKGARAINMEIKEIVAGRGTPNIDNNGTHVIYEGRENWRWRGALEYIVTVEGNQNSYRILKLQTGTDANGAPIYKYGYTTNHYKPIYEFVPKPSTPSPTTNSQ